MPLDGLEFFCLTPLPGSEDHQTLWKAGVAMDGDLNTYDVEHVCTGHARMSAEEWRGIYREAWDLYYSPAHMTTLLRRAAATGVPMKSLVKILVTFSSTVRLENVHPLQGGIVRLRHPSERRSTRTPESALAFWPRLAWDAIKVHASLARLIVRLVLEMRAIARDPRAHAYMDQALAPVGDDDDDSLDLMTQTTGARAAVAHVRKIAELTHAH